MANLGKILKPESTTVDQAGLHAYSQVFLVDSESLSGGMLTFKKDVDVEDTTHSVSNASIRYMEAEASSNMVVTPEEIQVMMQQDQTSAPAKSGPNLLEQHGIYEKICNNTQIAKLFEAEDLASFVDRICKETFPLIKPKEVHRYYECDEFRAALRDPASELR